MTATSGLIAPKVSNLLIGFLQSFVVTWIPSYIAVADLAEVLCPPCELGFYSTVSVEESNCLECQSMCQPCQNAPEFSSYVYNESGVVTSNGECPFQCDACLSGPDCAER